MTDTRTGYLPHPDGDGSWLYRENGFRYWRLTSVFQGVATGLWITAALDVDGLPGEWRRPFGAEEKLCEQDSMGRLTR